MAYSLRSSRRGWDLRDLLPHQLEGVARARALLDRYGGAILADEVGLGKSFVAAAIAHEARQRGATIELIIPAGLLAQWRDTATEFAIDPRVITHDALARDPFIADPACERLVIVDEAHAFRNRRTQRWFALARRSVAARLLLITATPICNSIDDLHSLVMLIIADDALRGCGVASIDDAFERRDRAQIAIVVSELLIRRARDVLPLELQFGALNRAVIRHDVFSAPGIDTLRFPLVGDGDATPLLRRILRRRLESSEAALLASLRRQSRFCERALDSLRRGRTLTKRDYLHAFGDDEGEALQQVLFWDAFTSTSSESIAPSELEDELARLDALAASVRESPCAKRGALLELCATIAEPLLIFTGAIATAFDAAAALRERGHRVAIAASGASPADAIEAFRRNAATILIATDLAAEGLNLQRAGVVIHYDIPWNPVKLEQRNGRAHRLGQRRDEVRAIYFVPHGDATRVMHIVAAKNRARRRALDSIVERATVDALLPPRLPRDAAALPLLAALRARRLRAPLQLLARRHRAGVELLMRELATEFLDAARVEELLAIIEREPHVR
jgi:superfamily II DNA or RNA helicase